MKPLFVSIALVMILFLEFDLKSKFGKLFKQEELSRFINIFILVVVADKSKDDSQTCQIALSCPQTVVGVNNEMSCEVNVVFESENATIEVDYGDGHTDTMFEKSELFSFEFPSRFFLKT